MREGLALSQQYPTDVLRVTYEMLCHNPRHVLDQIRNFAALGKDETFMSYAMSLLRPVKPKSPFDIASPIKQPFLETMLALGYRGEV